MRISNSSKTKILVAAILTFTIYTNTLYTVYAENIRPMANRDDSSKSGGLVGKVKPVIENLIKRQQIIIDKDKSLYASRAAELKTKLANFKDQNKANRVEQINTQLNKVNQKQTEAMTHQLSQMTKILEKIQTRASQSTDSAKLNLVNQNITTATDAIAAAQVVVDTQSKKQYIVAVATEETVKADAIKARDLLKSDLKTTQQSVKAARDAVIKTYQVIAPLNKENR